MNLHAAHRHLAGDRARLAATMRADLMPDLPDEVLSALSMLLGDHVHASPSTLGSALKVVHVGPKPLDIARTEIGQRAGKP